MIRILAAEVEIAAGFAFAMLKVAQSVLDDKWSTFSRLKIGLGYSLHGTANLCRGAIAMVPVINLLLLFYDGAVGRFNYEKEKMRKNVYPLTTAHELVR